MRVVGLVSLALGLSLFATNASALTQPDGTPIPVPISCASGSPGGLGAIFACQCTTPGICNIGAACPGGSTSCDDGKRGTCETTIWHEMNDNPCIPTHLSGLDPVAEAAVTPETFHPTCALTYTLLSRGTAMFHDLFGWYNVTGATPDPSDLHPMFGCGDALGTKVVLDLSKEPAYKGGEIGFFLLTPESHSSKKTCDSGDCCPSVARLKSGAGYVYYSQRSFNPDAAAGLPLIHLITYDSHISKNKYYFAWEDLFGFSDSDFTDTVVSVEGVQCSGGGVSCDTGKPGACSIGVTQCAAGAISCTQVVAARSEICNGVDDDCNGKIDDGATCPKPGDICVDGTCVGACETGEFKCPPSKACDPAIHKCVEAGCVGVTCPAGQLCHAGKCGAPCDGITCPYRSTCVGGSCLDPCASVHCDAGKVCRGGLCFAGCSSCDGIACSTGSRCDSASGDCVDASCSAPCPAGKHCASGSCVDDCAGAVCPTGQACLGGHCVDPGDAGVADSGPIDLTDGGGGPAPDGSAGDAGSGSGSGSPLHKGSCQCDVVGAHESCGGAAWAGLAGLLGVLASRRRGRLTKR